MQSSYQFAVEAHTASATIYFNGTLSLPAARQVIDACSLLPVGLRQLRVDARGVTEVHASALDELVVAFGVWRMERCGHTGATLLRSVCRMPRLLPVAS